MMSSAQWLGLNVEHWHPHLMLFAPNLGVEDLGASDFALPGLVMGQMAGTPTVIVPMPNFVELGSSD